MQFCFVGGTYSWVLLFSPNVSILLHAEEIVGSQEIKVILVDPPLPHQDEELCNGEGGEGEEEVCCAMQLGGN